MAWVSPRWNVSEINLPCQVWKEPKSTFAGRKPATQAKRPGSGRDTRLWVSTPDLGVWDKIFGSWDLGNSFWPELYGLHRVAFDHRRLVGSDAAVKYDLRCTHLEFGRTSYRVLAETSILIKLFFIY